MKSQETPTKSQTGETKELNLLFEARQLRAEPFKQTSGNNSTDMKSYQLDGPIDKIIIATVARSTDENDSTD
ncbi:hypothetical protein CHS0354_026612 [Potamilus streckersoni]|uniref:Uncharacterized protein n=1 Tax=Potamilus streckersoni TaxID=2493646 RepID=A0AAE0SV05_9BIVA|nr:hypothetical protein CHS0354_026612 [Potamilus streckersoni]